MRRTGGKKRLRLLRVGEPGSERPVAQDDDNRAFDLTSLPEAKDIDGRFFASDGPLRARAALAASDLEEVDIEGLRLGPPIARPTALICIGQNYAAHAAESGAAPPTTPIVFFKHPNTVVGPFDDVVIPLNSSRTDWEVELAVVIAKECRYLSRPEQAPGFIAGYAVSNDVSERAFQIDESGGQWSKGKSCETFNPLGPWLVPVDEVTDVQDLQLASWVNAEPRQSSTTADMIFSVNYLVWHLSQYMVLSPGDVVNTGTPQGVALSGRFPYLQPYDNVAMEVSGLGRQEQRLVPAVAQRHPGDQAPS